VTESQTAAVPWCAKRPDGTLAIDMISSDRGLVWDMAARKVDCYSRGAASLKEWDVVVRVTIQEAVTDAE
jgi:hypothetical protein